MTPETSLPGKIVQSLSSNSDIIIQRDRLSDSLFDRMARGFGPLSWWIKALLGLMMIALAALVGAAVQLLIVLTVVTGLLYLLAAILLSDHDAALQRQDQQLTEDISVLEQNLSYAVEHLSHVENRLKSVLTSLQSFNDQQGLNLQGFDQQAAREASQINQLNQLVDEVVLSQGRMDEYRSSLEQTLEGLRPQLESLKTDCEAFDPMLSVPEALNSLNTLGILEQAEQSLLDLGQLCEKPHGQNPSLGAGSEELNLTTTNRI